CKCFLHRVQRSHATIIHCRSCPIKNNGFNSFHKLIRSPLDSHPSFLPFDIKKSVARAHNKLIFYIIKLFSWQWSAVVVTKKRIFPLYALALFLFTAPVCAQTTGIWLGGSVYTIFAKTPDTNLIYMGGTAPPIPDFYYADSINSLTNFTAD